MRHFQNQRPTTKSVGVAVVIMMLGVLTVGAGENQSGSVSHVNASTALSQFEAGKKVFERQWYATAKGGQHGGLGPRYNAHSCAACHINNGRGRPPEPVVDDPSFLLRLSVPPQTDKQRVALALQEFSFVPVPLYGGQLQEKAISGAVAEGRVQISYHDKVFIFDDGERVVLRRPAYAIDAAGLGRLHAGLQMSPRIAQPLAGLGLLAAIPDAEIIAQADPNDQNGDGISGRINRVRNVETGEMVSGRFGWKATQPNLMQQTAAAFAQDIGISSKNFRQTSAVPREGEEISIVELRQVAAYLAGLDAPKFRPTEGVDLSRGRVLFGAIGCTSCHRPSYEVQISTTNGKTKKQIIHPYSDLLLHDMGAGLADHRAVAEASGWEWRTQPLWGAGRAGELNGNQFYLHDGRARTLVEAILWHSGEARAARAKFAALNKSDRDALIDFLQAL